MNQFTVKDFGKILKKNAQSQRHELLASGTDVFRIYDRNQEDFPITVDIYANYARVQIYSNEELEDQVLDTIKDQINRMVYIDSDKILFSYKNKREKRQQHEKNEIPSVEVEVMENGLRFKTNLTTYTDTGLFLDHINTRNMIKEMSAGQNVFNLFSYTGAFSVYAASGRAAKVTSVDLSATYTRWAEENLKLNGYEGTNYPCVCCDATKFVDDEIKANNRYDIIIFDPPSFSNSHKMEEDFDVQKDFYTWIKKLCSLLTKNGVIMFSTNLGSFKIDKRRLRGLNVKEMTNQLWADGFVKGRKGTTRSWIMALDDNSLTLDWSEDRAEKKEKRESRESGNRGRYSEERKPRKYNTERRSSYGERNRDRGYRDRDSVNRDFGNRENRERRPARDHRDFSDKREFRSRDDRNSRNFDHSRYDHRDYENKKFDRPKYEHKDRFEHDERRSRDDFRERRPRREHTDYESKHRFTERRDDQPRKPRKPYGYDSFKPARSRDDSSDFFWNED